MELYNKKSFKKLLSCKKKVGETCVAALSFKKNIIFYFCCVLIYNVICVAQGFKIPVYLLPPVKSFMIITPFSSLSISFQERRSGPLIVNPSF